jgi:hypothetical protein
MSQNLQSGAFSFSSFCLPSRAGLTAKVLECGWAKLNASHCATSLSVHPPQMPANESVVWCMDHSDVQRIIEFLKDVEPSERRQVLKERLRQAGLVSCNDFDPRAIDCLSDPVVAACHASLEALANALAARDEEGVRRFYRPVEGQPSAGFLFDCDEALREVREAVIGQWGDEGGKIFVGLAEDMRTWFEKMAISVADNRAWLHSRSPDDTRASCEFRKLEDGSWRITTLCGSGPFLLIVDKVVPLLRELSVDIAAGRYGSMKEAEADLDRRADAILAEVRG